MTDNRGIEPEAVDHQGANGGIRAADNQGSRLESEAMDGGITHFNSIAAQTAPLALLANCQATASRAADPRGSTVGALLNRSEIR